MIYQKIILSIVTMGCILTAGYFITFQNETPNVVKNTRNTTQSGTESNTFKRLKTVSESGSSWGMTPFGSGKPLTGGDTQVQKPLFKSPNLEWKTRQIALIDGRILTYEFGKGNPPSADPLSEKEKEIYKNCLFEPELTQISCGRPGEEVDGYITSDIEKDLVTLLSSPLWGPIFKNYEMQFRQNEYPEWGVTYDQVVYGDYMNMENILMINEQTGRKSLSFGNFQPLRSWFNNALRERQEVMGKDILNINNCITQNGGFELYRTMDVIYQKQFYPLGNYPLRITDPKKYIPWY